MSGDREALRLVFDQDAVLYDRARPRYPDVLFDAIDRSVVEARAREPDLGAELAQVARANLAAVANVEVITADADRWEGQAEAFELSTARRAPRAEVR